MAAGLGHASGCCVWGGGCVSLVSMYYRCETRWPIVAAACLDGPGWVKCGCGVVLCWSKISEIIPLITQGHLGRGLSSARVGLREGERLVQDV